MLMAFAPPAASVPPMIVATISQIEGHPPSATTIAGTVVTRSSSMMRGLVSAMNAPIRVRAATRPSRWLSASPSRDGTRGRLARAIATRETTPDARGSPKPGRGWARLDVMPAGDVQTAPTTGDAPTTDDVVEPDVPWIVIVWNDPINLMSYVVLVFQKLFGYSREKATELMLDVHHKGRAVVSNGSREKAELDVFRLHEHGLWATMQQDK